MDVVLLTTYSTFPGCLIKARPIGVLLMKDEKGTDNKIVAVPIEEVILKIPIIVRDYM